MRSSSMRAVNAASAAPESRSRPWVASDTVHHRRHPRRRDHHYGLFSAEPRRRHRVRRALACRRLGMGESRTARAGAASRLRRRRAAVAWCSASFSPEPDAGCGRRRGRDALVVDRAGRDPDATRGASNRAASQRSGSSSWCRHGLRSLCLHGSEPMGRALAMTVLLIVWAADIGAYGDRPVARAREARAEGEPRQDLGGRDRRGRGGRRGRVGRGCAGSGSRPCR